MRVDGAHGYRLTSTQGQLADVELPPLVPAADHVVVEVAGCGLCHTDIGYAYDGVPTRHPLPLIQGHEIAGKVVDASEKAAEWIGRSVVVPAVIPCGACEACHAGRPTICRKQFMPGNDGDGGFASHVVVPARGLCAVPDVLPHGLTLDMLSVVADAVTTPFEALTRAEVGSDDLVIVVGAGGIGGFGVQIAAAFGAGQQTAWGLLDFGAYLAVVGYTAEKVEVRLSNLMAFDATARGNWGCAPANYPPALKLVLERKIVLEPYVERHTLNELPELFEASSRHEVKRRAIVRPQ